MLEANRTKEEIRSPAMRVGSGSANGPAGAEAAFPVLRVRVVSAGQAHPTVLAIGWRH